MNEVYIIAEAGVNHDGSEKKAFELIDIAADCGADAVKFQLFRPEALVAGLSTQAEHQTRNLKSSPKSERQIMEMLALSPDIMSHLAQHCALRKIDFLCTAFDTESLDYLVSNTRMPYIKLASGDITNGPLLVAAARTSLPIILSTGMSDMEEISTALCLLHFGYTRSSGHPTKLSHPTPLMLKFLREKVVLMHSVSHYPAPAHSIHLLAMDTLANTFGLPVGFSDHSLGLSLPIAAAARGAVAIEKHFTHDVKAKGSDHAASLGPDMLKAMVLGLREVTQAMGGYDKLCQPEEADSRVSLRRSLVAACPIIAGDVFSEQNLACKRPAMGLPPNTLWELLGKTAKRDYDADECIDERELD